MKKYILFIFGAVLLASCSTVKKNATATDVNMSVNQYPIIVETEVLAKVEASTSWVWNPFARDRFNLRKGNLVAETLKKYDADVILEPQFIISKQGFGERSIILMGYPAKYKSFRNTTESDLKALEAVGNPNELIKYNEAGGVLNIFK